MWFVFRRFLDYDNEAIILITIYRLSDKYGQTRVDRHGLLIVYVINQHIGDILGLHLSTALPIIISII